MDEKEYEAKAKELLEQQCDKEEEMAKQQEVAVVDEPEPVVTSDIKDSQLAFHNDPTKTIDEQASDIIAGIGYQEAIKDEKLQQETIDSASHDIRAKNKARINKAKAEEQKSTIDRLKNVTSAKIESDEAHYKRHLAVLSRWGVTQVIPKPVAILYEILGYVLQFLFIISIGWLIYTAKFMCEVFHDLPKSVWAITGTALGVGVLALLLWGMYQLFMVLQGVGV